MILNFRDLNSSFKILECNMVNFGSCMDRFGKDAEVYGVISLLFVFKFSRVLLHICTVIICIRELIKSSHFNVSWSLDPCWNCNFTGINSGRIDA